MPPCLNASLYCKQQSLATLSKSKLARKCNIYNAFIIIHIARNGGIKLSVTVCDTTKVAAEQVQSRSLSFDY